MCTEAHAAWTVVKILRIVELFKSSKVYEIWRLTDHVERLEKAQTQTNDYLFDSSEPADAGAMGRLVTRGREFLSG